MPEFWDYIKGIFKSSEESSPSNPVEHQLIERTEEEKKDYDFWKNTLIRRRLQDWLSNQYAIYSVAPDNIDDALDFLNTPSSKGFVVHFHKTQYSQRDVTHFFDFLKEKVLELDYRPQISDTRTYSRASWVETIQRHYLKPRPFVKNEGKFRQLFGNVMIEMEFRNEQVHNLRFRATSYNDHLYQEAKEFRLLMQQLVV
jgi:hypothetical protein